MKKALFALLAVSVVATVSGCASTNQASSASADKNEGEVITGSRIPRKGGGSDAAVSTQGGGDYKRDKN
jgi:hypothetical protein